LRQLSTSQQQVASLQSLVDDLRSKLSAVELESAHRALPDPQLEALQTNNAQLTGDIEQLSLDLQRAQEHLTEKEGAWQRERELLSSEIVHLKQDVERVTATLLAQQMLLGEEKAVFAQTLEAKKAKFQAQAKKIEELISIVSNQEKEIKDGKSRQHTLEKSEQTLNCQLQSMAAQAHESVRKCQTLESELQARVKSLEELQAAFDVQAAKIGSLESALPQLSTSLSMSTATMSTADMLEAAEQVKVQLQSQVSNLTQALAQLKAKAQLKLSEYRAALEKETKAKLEIIDQHQVENQKQLGRIDELEMTLSSERRKWLSCQTEHGVQLQQMSAELAAVKNKPSQPRVVVGTSSEISAESLQSELAEVSAKLTDRSSKLAILLKKYKVVEACRVTCLEKLKALEQVALENWPSEIATSVALLEASAQGLPATPAPAAAPAASAPGFATPQKGSGF
jgi:chromosome segregation ATPase